MAKEFKKQIIAIDNEGLKRAEAIAGEKMNILSDAIKEAEKHIEVTYFKEFCEDFITYTTKKIVENNKALKDLNLSNDKVLNLLDINLNELYNLQVKFEEKLFKAENAKVKKWLIETGDDVEVDDPILLIETSKEEIVIKSTASGELKEKRFQEGDLINIGDENHIS